MKKNKAWWAVWIPSDEVFGFEWRVAKWLVVVLFLDSKSNPSVKWINNEVPTYTKHGFQTDLIGNLFKESKIKVMTNRAFETGMHPRKMHDKTHGNQYQCAWYGPVLVITYIKHGSFLAVENYKLFSLVTTVYNRDKLQFNDRFHAILIQANSTDNFFLFYRMIDKTFATEIIMMDHERITSLESCDRKTWETDELKPKENRN